MSALYRRYRPETFAEVIGQEHVTSPLSVALTKDRVNHAYLFSGPRGCGKTSSARILARCLNCEQGPAAVPCGVCPSCLDLARGGPGSLDVVEIDAASHGGVDDARDLRERAAFAPVRDRFKVFIIDEAHMVSTQGFNALLKIVEEPPEHVRFIFATTEPEKVIGTIRSRTHHYPFRLVPPERLQAYLSELCEREGVPVGPGVLALVVRAGAGSVRDSLSVLDQLIAGAGADGLTYPLAVQLLGYTDGALLDDVIDALAAGDGAAVFAVVNRVVESGHDPRRFVEDLLERLRDLLVVSVVRDGAHALLRTLADDQLSRMQGQAARFGAAELSRAADVTNAALTEMTGATSPRLQVELLCARLLLPEADQRGLGARLERLEKRVGVAVPAQPTTQPAAQPSASQDSPAKAPTAKAAPAQVSQTAPAQTAPAQTAPAQTEPPPAKGSPASEAAPAPAAKAPPDAPRDRPAGAARPETPAVDQPPTPPEDVPGRVDAQTVRRMWPEVLSCLSGMKRATWSLVSQYAQVLDYDGQRLLLGFASAGLVGQFNRGAHQEFLRQALIEVMGLDCRLEAVADGAPGHRPVRAGATPPAPPPDDVPPPDDAPPEDSAPPETPVPPEAATVAGAPPTDSARLGGGVTPAGDGVPPERVVLPADPPARVGRRASGPAIRLDDDEPSPDDPEYEGSGLVGPLLVEQLLGGQVIEERAD